MKEGRKERRKEGRKEGSLVLPLPLRHSNFLFFPLILQKLYLFLYLLLYNLFLFLHLYDCFSLILIILVSFCSILIYEFIAEKGKLSLD